MAEVNWIDNRTILTRTSGFLRSGYTHTINPYLGCTFSGRLCGTFCYAQHNPWITRGRRWMLYGVKRNVREAYRHEYDRLKRPRRGLPQPLRIDMSSSTDPYIPQEQHLGHTRALLQEMLQRPLDVLVLQTHNTLIQRDLDCISQLSAQCELWVSLTVETDMDPVPGFPAHVSPPAARLAVLKQFREAGVLTQSTLSPLMPLADPAAFAHHLDEGCVRIIIDWLERVAEHEQQCFAQVTAALAAQAQLTTQALEAQRAQSQACLSELQAIRHQLQRQPEISIRYPNSNGTEGSLPAIVGKE